MYLIYMASLTTPVLFIIFNRPDTTKLVFEQIRKAKPKQLFVAADGPRDTIPQDEIKCARARDIIKQVDWDCDVKTLFQESNLGCGLGVGTAITWFFNHVEEGIILEDDCLPHISFFYYCQELLEYYRNNDRIMSISGNNFQKGIKRGKASYYFSKYPHIWGWASWRRSWKKFNLDIQNINIESETKKMYSKFNIFSNKDEYNFWLNNFLLVQNRKIDTWDIQWVFSVWNNDGIAILPNMNLVSNIGFNEDATHTKMESLNYYVDRFAMKFPLKHPQKIKVNKQADLFTFYHVFRPDLKPSLKRFIYISSQKIREGMGSRYPTCYQYLRMSKRILKSLISRFCLVV